MRLSILIFLLSVYLLVAADFEEYRQSDEEDGDEEELRSIGSSSSSSSSESDENCSDGDGNCKKTVIVVEPKRRPAARPRPSTSSPPTRRPPAPAAPAPAPAQFSSPCPGASPKDLCPGERAALRAAWIQFMAEVEDAKRAAPGLEGQWQSAIIENLVLLNAEQTRGLNGDVQGPEEGHTNNLGGGAQQVQPITSNGQQANQPERELQPAGQFDLGQPGEAPSGSGLFREKRQQNGGSSQQGDAAVTCQEFTFDSRQKWPQCASVIGNIRDQSLCGDCWAVSASSSFSDRRCIQRAKQGQPIDPSEDNFFSAYDTAVCSDGAGGDDACKGGSTAKAWRWYTNTGVVTGGGNNQNGTCRPYPFPPTAQADQTIYQAPLSECTARCVSSNLEARYNSDKAMARNWNYLYGTDGWEEAMRNEIFNNGPISASLVVFEDFKTYSGGVYSHVTGNQLGGHAIRLIGYGNISCSNGLTQKYWLGANSWNVDWGLGGFFKIVRGVNMCEIESRQISYGMPTT